MSIRHLQFIVTEDSSGEGIVAHFPAHINESISALTFDPSGTLLFTAGSQGHSFHIFRLMNHPCTSGLGAVHHLYVLYRGDTAAKVYVYRLMKFLRRVINN